MVWPWKGDDNSPASFEKALSGLATKITASQAQLDSLRSRGRRVKVLWTLYCTFAYLLSFVILFLVVGWRDFGALEFTGLSASPLVIYFVRSAITSYYNFRIDSVSQRLEEQQAERNKTIEKLKAATKYNSTQQLLEKYGAATPKPRKPAETSKPKVTQQKNAQRTSTGPPPTANIPRPDQVSPLPQPSPPQPATVQHRPIQYVRDSPAPPQVQAVIPATAEFAPNAFSAPTQYAAGSDSNFSSGHWYDRMLDLLMGEDETSPKNRVVLICTKCRLVNGQAPPGVKTLSELGKWRCYGCGELNGEDDEAAKVVAEMKERIGEGQEAASPVQDGLGEAEQEVSSEEDLVKVASAAGAEEVEEKPIRGRQKGRRDKKA